MSFCSDVLNTLQSDNYSNKVYVLGYKYVLGPPHSSFSLPPYGSGKNDSESYPNLNVVRTFHRFNPGGVRTLIALHHGRKTKNKSFASCRGRVKISGSSKNWSTWNLMEIHCLLPFLRKLKSVCGPVRLLFFLRDKFVVRRQLKRFRKNRNCSLARESIHLAAVSHTADGCVNNIKVASYLTRNRPLTCKRIPKRQRPSNTRTIFHVIHLKA